MNRSASQLATGQVVATVIKLLPKYMDAAYIVREDASEPCFACGRNGLTAIYAKLYAKEVQIPRYLEKGDYSFIKHSVFCELCDTAIRARSFERFSESIRTSQFLERRRLRSSTDVIWTNVLQFRRYDALHRPDDFRFGETAGLARGSLAVCGTRGGAPFDSHEWLLNHPVVPRDEAQSFKGTYRHIYGYAIPNLSALEAIERESPTGVIDFGAGVGYWSYLLRERGTVEVDAIDKQRPDAPGNEWFQQTSKSWTDIRHGDEDSLVKFPKTKSLLLIYPPPGYSSSMAFHALSRFRGDTVIFVGMRCLATGSASFHETLSRWTLADTITVPTFFVTTEKMFVFTREKRLGAAGSVS